MNPKTNGPNHLQSYLYKPRPAWPRCGWATDIGSRTRLSLWRRMIRQRRCSESSTALDPVTGQRTVRVTHPFHPWLGREFVLLAVRQTWSQDRVFFLDARGRQHSLPVGWTDAAEPDVFVTVAAGRCPFRFADLLELRGLIDGLTD